jgi:hypothetical protein
VRFNTTTWTVEYAMAKQQTIHCDRLKATLAKVWYEELCAANKRYRNAA